MKEKLLTAWFQKISLDDFVVLCIQQFPQIITEHNTTLLHNIAIGADAIWRDFFKTPLFLNDEGTKTRITMCGFFNSEVESSLRKFEKDGACFVIEDEYLKELVIKMINQIGLFYEKNGGFEPFDGRSYNMLTVFVNEFIGHFSFDSYEDNVKRKTGKTFIDQRGFDGLAKFLKKYISFDEKSFLKGD